MNLHIPLSHEAEARLREQALAAGKDIESFVLEVLEQKLSTACPSTQDASEPESGDRLLGLFADEPDLMDEIMESVYENRVRPLRVE